MSGRFRMIAVGAALTLIVGHGTSLRKAARRFASGITAPATY